MKLIYSLVVCIFLSSNFITAQTTVTFNHIGAMQTFVVPGGVFSIDVDMTGASGGDIGNMSQAPFGGQGGRGGRVQCTFPVTPNSTIYLFVGGHGTGDSLTLTCFTANGGFNGGGIGYGGYNSFNYNAGGGGGASDIRIGGMTLTDRKLIAGGGGGASCSGCTGGAALGGHGGGLAGQDGQSISCFPTCNFGYGGTAIAGGANGSWACTVGNSTPGALGIGGNGEQGPNVTCGAGGGGGGGYYGGGGGGLGPGGGGSSYTDNLATNVVHTQGFHTGDGYISITYDNCFAFSLAAANDSVCQGGQTSLLAQGGTTYTWSPANTLSCTNCQNPIASPTVTTCYTVTVADTGNCTITDTICVVVLNCTSIEEELTASDISLAPNPFNTSFVINFSKSTAATLQVLNVLGNVVYTERVNGKQANINIAEMPMGIYLVRINTTTGSITKKIIKQ
jgi:hypothetical protein